MHMWLVTMHAEVTERQERKCNFLYKDRSGVNNLIKPKIKLFTDFSGFNHFHRIIMYLKLSNYFYVSYHIIQGKKRLLCF